MCYPWLIGSFPTCPAVNGSVSSLRWPWRKSLLLDEPTAFLDINHQIEICSLIGRLRAERQLTVVLVSHDLNVASQYCDRVLMLKEGKLCRIGSPGETIRSDVLRSVYGCEVVVDTHPQTGRPRVTMPMRVSPAE